jgi:hypothetical protein
VAFFNLTGEFKTPDDKPINGDLLLRPVGSLDSAGDSVTTVSRSVSIAIVAGLIPATKIAEGIYDVSVKFLSGEIQFLKRVQIVSDSDFDALTPIV